MDGRRRTRLLALGMLGVFLAGAATGAMTMVGIVHSKLRELHSTDSRAALRLGVELLDWRLDLSPQQETEVGAILTDVNRDMLQFKTRHNDELRAILMPGVERIDAQLTPAQRERWAPLRQHLVEHIERTAESDLGH